MDLLDGAIRYLALLEHAKRDCARTIQFLKGKRTRFFQQVGAVALIPQIDAEQRALIHIGDDYLAQLPHYDIISRLEGRIAQLEGQAAQLRFSYFPEQLMSTQQRQIVNKRIQSLEDEAVPGWALRVENGGIQVEESFCTAQRALPRKISKFAINHNLY